MIGKKEQHVVMVMDVLGPSLDRLLFSTYMGTRGFSSRTILLLTQQLIQRLEVLASHKIVHNDIQPGNMLMGVGGGLANGNRTVHLIDFGLSRNIQNVSVVAAQSSINNEIDGKGVGDVLNGTLAFSSVAAMQGNACCEKDDVEALCYSLTYLLSNSLSWIERTDSDALAGSANSTSVSSSKEDDVEHDRILIQQVLKYKRQLMASPDSIRKYLYKHHSDGDDDEVVADNSNTSAGRCIMDMLVYIQSMSSTQHTPDYQYLQQIVSKYLIEEDSSGSGSSSNSNSNSSSNSSMLVYDWEEAGISWNASGLTNSA